jgi:intracellular septation protein A
VKIAGIVLIAAAAVLFAIGYLNEGTVAAMCYVSGAVAGLTGYLLFVIANKREEQG